MRPHPGCFPTGCLLYSPRWEEIDNMDWKRWFKRVGPFLQRTLVFVLVVSQLAGAAVFAAPSGAPASSRDRQDYIVEPPQPNGTGGGMTIELSEGEASGGAVEVLPPAETAPLSAEETAALLDRLPPLPVEAADEADFRLPPSTLPAPRTGDVISQTFPPAEPDVIPEALPTGPLEVVRYAPDGAIPVAPFLSVTFNQPMVPLGTLEQLSAETVPVTLTPDLPGEWRWIGTQTLTFEYTGDVDRFPKATEFTAEVPAGTTSATGGVLAESVTWSFRTPPPVMVQSYPSFGPQSRDPLFFIAFDQRIDPASVLATVQVTAARESYALRLASEEEVAADETVARLAEAAGDARWLAFRSESWLPADTTVNVAVGPGTPSLEGPLTTETVQSYSFQTYAPLRIVESYCEYGGSDCPPLAPFTIRFNNPLEEERFDPALVTVEPETPDLIVELLYDAIRVRGVTQGRTDYSVTVSGELSDIFGQTLGEAVTLKFRTGDAPRALMGPENVLVTLDPSAATPGLSVYSINYDSLRARAYAVTPEDWPAYMQYLRDFRYDRDRPEPPGRKVLEESIPVAAARDQLAETMIDLSDALPDGLGHLIVVVDVPTIPIVGELLRRDDPFVVTWVQATQIGLDGFADNARLIAWTTALQDGAPLPGVTLRLLNSASVAVTDDQGTVALSLPDRSAPLLVGELDADVAILPANPYYWDEAGWLAQPLQDELRWYVFDDRQMYRPGEEVHVKGWLRRIEAGPAGDVALPGAEIGPVTYEIYDPRGNELGRGTVELTALAGFDLAFTLPENANLGYANLLLRAQGGGMIFGADYSHSFQIQEFRRPEFEVSARIEQEGPHFLGDTVEASVSAQYFAGGPLPGAETVWDVTNEAASYSPPNWPDFVFGEWVPWWFHGGPFFYEAGFEGGSEMQSFSGRTDAAGEHYLQMTFAEMAEPRPYRVNAAARVTDVNRQTWSSAANLLVHPAEVYVGLRSATTFVQQGQPLEIDAIVTDVDGEPVAGQPTQVTAVRLLWQFENNDWIQKEVDPQTCTFESTEEPAACVFETENGGEYRITAEVRDEQDRLNRTVFTRWVSGGQQPPARNVEQESAQLIPDKQSYQPGETAEILVQSPFAPAEGLLTVARSGILYTERFTMDEATTTLQIPLEEAHIPNVHVQVDLVGSAPRTDDMGQVVAAAPPRPAYATGALELTIPPLSRTLTVALEPAATELAPGAETSVDVTLTDTAGQPVPDAEVALIVVDEAILALSNYTLADPVALFYQPRGSDTHSAYGRSSVVLTDAQALAEQMLANMERSTLSAAMAAPSPAAGEYAITMESAAFDMEAPAEESAAGAQAAGAPIAVRSDFNPLATFAPAVYTDEAGRATVQVQLPDNLTRYRIMAVAVADQKYFGSAEANLTARLPLMVRPSAPRFLNFGDRFELPVVVQNQTDDELSVDLAVRGSNLELTGDPGVNVTVPANDRVEVRFPAATANAGTTRLQFAAASGDFADAQQVELPVYTPATTEAFATYGVIDEGAIVQPIARPENVYPQFGGLELSTSSTALQALTDAVLYLNSYPFECSEQIASRVMGIAALRDVLSAFQAEGLPAPAELEAAINRDIAQLEALQMEDGGWPVWSRSNGSIPFYSIHVAHALQKAKDKGFSITPDVQLRALDYLRNVENYYPYWYSARTRHMLSSYALYVRQLMGDVDVAKAQRIYGEMPLDDQSLDAVAWLWQVFSGEPGATAQVEEIRRHVNNRVVETPGAANFVIGFDEQAYLLLQSNRRTDALLLDAMINDDPANDLIPKVVNGLLAHRTAGRWDNTQENVFVLLAMDNYFNTFEAQTPDFVARMWLGETYVAEHAFQGRSTDTQLTTVPMAYLVEGDDLTDLIVAKDGDGRLYYRLGMRYAPDDLDLDPLDMGFIVQRRYEAVDDPADVQLGEDGVWRVKAGARVRITVEMVAPTRRYHVALIDPLPAGFEAINPALAVSETPPGAAPDEPTPYGTWWWGPWYEHQNLRDQRAEAFSTLLWEGIYEYSYVARAITPGDFVVPPAKAEEMYAPEVFGRSASDRVVIELG
jgi:uncharacterized protein YfaS (alpha-2-macroglobulin family)